jgi:hypothetical protein
LKFNSLGKSKKVVVNEPSSSTGFMDKSDDTTQSKQFKCNLRRKKGVYKSYDTVNMNKAVESAKMKIK